MKMQLVSIKIIFIALGVLFSPVLFSFSANDYRHTCHSCQVIFVHHQRYLNCSCLNRQQFLRNTSIPMRRNCIRIENIDGRLTCTRFIRPRPIMPPHHRFERFVSISAGPIWNNAGAQQKCVRLCSMHVGGSWTGQWHTVREHVNSVCECRLPQRYRRYIVDVPAGPIWNNIYAHRVCPLVCMRQPRGNWTGQWHTVKAGVASVCQCNIER